MKLYMLIKQVTLISCLFFSTTSIAMLTEDKLPEQFAGSTENSTLSMDFSVVDELLHAGVLDMGQSTRNRSKASKPQTGTRMKQPVDRYTESEANRFFYESLIKQQEEILNLRKNLELIPSETPLHLYTNAEQLAYWLNLYNVTVINEIAKIYPLSTLKHLITDDSPLLNKKILNVNGISLSLSDIYNNILLNKYNKEPLIMYGLYQGYIGGPNIRKKAYTGKSVFTSLKDNAVEFINSNRGTQFNGKESSVRVSSIYKRYSILFPDFHNDLKKHLVEFSKKSITNEIAQAESFVPNISNWRVTDLYGSARRYEGAVSTGTLLKRRKMSFEQIARLKEIMQIRAINFGGGSVTVTDLESED